MWLSARPKAVFDGPCSLPVLLAVLAFSSAFADGEFPGQGAGRSLFEIQRKVDSLFEDGQYERALIIYRNELAPVGDKYAQYMVGYMYLAGKGVEADAATAAAWFRLAAERREQRFVSATEKLYAELPLTQREVANEQFLELRNELGDVALLMRYVDEDIATLRSQLQEPALAQGVVTVADNAASTDSAVSGELALIRLESRIMARLNYAAAALRTDRFATEAEVEQLRELQRRGESIVRDSRRSR